GVTPRTHPLVLAAIAANRVLGRDAELASASTDANVPIALGIPAIALGAGGKAGDAHLATEWYENTEGALGIVRALLVTVAMAELERRRRPDEQVGAAAPPHCRRDAAAAPRPDGHGTPFRSAP